MDLREFGALRRPKIGSTMNETKTPNRDKSELNDPTSPETPINLICAPLGGMIAETANKKKFLPQEIASGRENEIQKIQKPSNNSTLAQYNRNDSSLRQNDNRRHDENSNDRWKPNNPHRNGYEDVKNRSKIDIFRASRMGNNSVATTKQTQNNVVPGELMSEQAKKELMKMDEDLVFQRETRDRVDENEKTSLAISSSPLRRENAIRAKPIENRISKTDYIDVIVVHPMADGSFWCHRKIDGPTIAQMMQELQTKTACYPVVTELIVDEIYATKYENLWHRVILVSKNPSTVFYVDYGNQETSQSNEFRSIADFPKYPPAAIRLRLKGDRQRELGNFVDGNCLKVKMISVDDEGVVEVEEAREDVTEIRNESTKMPKNLVEAGNVGAAASKVVESIASPSKATEIVNEVAKVTTNVEKSTTNKVPSIVDCLVKSNVGFIQIFMALNNNSYAVCVLRPDFTAGYQMVYETLNNLCDKAGVIENFKPRVGDFVCGERSKCWVRGYVFSLGPPIRLTLVDEARVSTVERVIPMPKEVVDVRSFGSICTFAKIGYSFEIDETAEFNVVAVETSGGEKIVKAVLTSPERLKNVEVTLKNWSPTPEQKGIGFADLKTNSKVCITAYTSERIMFVRSLDDDSLERTRTITQNVAKWAQKAPMLDGPPAIGQLVIAKFTDGNFYRAIVTKLLDGKFGVSYVDYGNRDTATINDLRILSDELKNERSCAAKIVLKDIKTDVPPTQDVHQYLNLLVGKEEPLVCTFDGIPSKDGVILTTSTGESVNDKVNEYLTPSWQREDPSKNTKCFTMMELEYAKLGEPGQATKALVLYASDAPFKYCMCPYDTEHISHVTTILPTLLNDYCKSTNVHYIPRVSELCLAVFEDSWYRGLCLNPSASPTQAIIYFIDFGNTENVDHTKLREMTKDFMSPAALGCLCEVKNLGVELINGEIPKKVKERLDALIPINDLVDIKIIRKMDDGDYEVELPQVRQKLVEEGLVSSS